MSLLSRFARSRTPEVAVPELPADCRHWELAPRWDNAEDIGEKDKIVSFKCTNCHDEFTPEEAERFAAA
jgi:hypothetical protein